MALEIHVRSGASVPSVGGQHDGALVVRVAEPADAGRATEAALRAVAAAIGVPRRSVTLVRGATTRRKLLDIDDPSVDTVAVAARIAGLMGGVAGPR